MNIFYSSFISIKLFKYTNEAAKVLAVSLSNLDWLQAVVLRPSTLPSM